MAYFLVFVYAVYRLVESPRVGRVSQSTPTKASRGTDKTPISKRVLKFLPRGLLLHGLIFCLTAVGYVAGWNHLVVSQGRGVGGDGGTMLALSILLHFTCVPVLAVFGIVTWIGLKQKMRMMLGNRVKVVTRRVEEGDGGDGGDGGERV
jgi:hypothetical protein